MGRHVAEYFTSLFNRAVCCRNGAIDADILTLRKRVRVATQAVKGTGNVMGGERISSLEKHVFRKMCDTVLSFVLKTAACSKPEANRSCFCLSFRFGDKKNIVF